MAQLNSQNSNSQPNNNSNNNNNNNTLGQPLYFPMNFANALAQQQQQQVSPQPFVIPQIHSPPLSNNNMSHNPTTLSNPSNLLTNTVTSQFSGILIGNLDLINYNDLDLDVVQSSY